MYVYVACQCVCCRKQKNAMISLPKSRALPRAGEVDAFLVPQVVDSEMCLCYLGSAYRGTVFNSLYLFYLLSARWFQR